MHCGSRGISDPAPVQGRNRKEAREGLGRSGKRCQWRQGRQLQLPRMRVCRHLAYRMAVRKLQALTLAQQDGCDCNLASRQL